MSQLPRSVCLAVEDMECWSALARVLELSETVVLELPENPESKASSFPKSSRSG